MRHAKLLATIWRAAGAKNIDVNKFRLAPKEDEDGSEDEPTADETLEALKKAFGMR